MTHLKNIGGLLQSLGLAQPAVCVCCFLFSESMMLLWFSYSVDLFARNISTKTMCQAMNYLLHSEKKAVRFLCPFKTWRNFSCWPRDWTQNGYSNWRLAGNKFKVWISQKPIFEEQPNRMAGAVAWNLIKFPRCSYKYCLWHRGNLGLDSCCVSHCKIIGSCSYVHGIRFRPKNCPNRCSTDISVALTIPTR